MLAVVDEASLQSRLDILLKSESVRGSKLEGLDCDILLSPPTDLGQGWCMELELELVLELKLELMSQKYVIGVVSTNIRHSVITLPF